MIISSAIGSLNLCLLHVGCQNRKCALHKFILRASLLLLVIKTRVYMFKIGSELIWERKEHPLFGPHTHGEVSFYLYSCLSVCTRATKNPECATNACKIMLYEKLRLLLQATIDSAFNF